MTLEQFEPSTFNHFVEFMYYASVSHFPMLEQFQVPESAAAWVLGDYLDAIEFKNCAMDHLFHAYMVTTIPWRTKPLLPSAIEYCCVNSTPGSRLRKLYLSIAVKYWTEKSRVVYNASYTDHSSYSEHWSEIWTKYPEFRDELLRSLCQKDLVETASSITLAELMEPVKTDKKL